MFYHVERFSNVCSKINTKAITQETQTTQRTNEKLKQKHVTGVSSGTENACDEVVSKQERMNFDRRKPRATADNLRQFIDRKLLYVKRRNSSQQQESYLICPLPSTLTVTGKES